MKIASTPTTLFIPLDYHHHHHHEIKSDNIQESGRAAETPSSDDDVDTTLSLAAAAAVPDDIHGDHHEAVSMIDLAKFPNDTDFLGLSTTADCSRNYKNDGSVDGHNYRVTALNAIPLRSYHPSYGYMDYPKQAINLAKLRTSSDFLGLGIGALSKHKINHGRPINPKPLRSYHPTYASSTGMKRMREQKVNNVRKGGKRSKVDEYPDPITPPSELVERVGQGIRPVFVYRKQLKEWDTKDHQNRLFVNDREKLMVFLTEEERRALEDPKRPGIDLVGIDRMGREYDLHSNVWKSMDMAVFNKGWRKIVADNRAKKGDWVHLWAYRRGQADEFCLYVDFRDQP